MKQQRWLGSLVGVLMVGGVLVAPAAQAAGSTYHQRNLVADRPYMAEKVDPNLVNPWGMSMGPSTPLWVSDNGTNVSTIYSGAVGASSPIQVVPLVVTVPRGAPTGQVFNDTHAFFVPGTGWPSAFIFAGEGGFLSAWNPQLADTTKAVLVAHTTGAVYKGLALVRSPSGPQLLVANFHDNRIDVFDRGFHRVQSASLYRDPALPNNYAPFNVVAIGQRVVVTYAQQDPTGHDDVPGNGHGFIDVFTNSGQLVHRLVTRGALNSPWGLAVAPAHFGVFSGALLVGNFGDGRIHAYDMSSGALLGTLRGSNNQPLAIDGLWGLLVGNGTAGSPNAVWFSAGPQGEAHGLLGQLTVN